MTAPITSTMHDASNQASEQSFLDALNPAGSYVVTACAGSGKTWLLASRMLRLLLAGAEPGSILALTFTRKAAGEMRERLMRWCRELALMEDDAKVVQFLIERGLRNAEARASVDAALGLLDKLLDAQPGIAIDTFHGWFLGLIKLAPLAAPGNPDSGSHATLTENTGALREEAWQQFAAHLGADAQSADAQAFERLMRELGLYNAKQGLMNLLARRAEWWAYGQEREDAVADADAQLRAQLGVRNGVDPVKEMAAREREAMREFLPLLMQNSVKPDVTLAPVLHRLLDPDPADQAIGQAWFDAIKQVWLQKEGAPRATRKASGALRERLGRQMERFLELHAHLAAAMQAVDAAQSAARACAINVCALRAGALLIHEYQSLKTARGLIDFTDAEWGAAQQLTDPDHAAYLHARLDARYRHVLLDEFQDTNRLQWAALKGWFEAYGDDSARPSVLLVGDPKQSIYRFRRADARLFDAAAEWLATNWKAQTRTQNKTRRNAPAVVDAINAVFSRAGLTHFAPHATWCTGLAGRVEALPLIADEKVAVPPRSDLRDPLTEARPEQRDERDLKQGRQLAARLRELAGRVLLHDAGVEGNQRPARWSDILILARKKSVFTGIEAALRESGIPYVTARGGGLLEIGRASCRERV